MAVDGETLRVTLRNWSSGVTVVTARDQDRYYGMTVSSFASVSLQPPLVLVCLHKETETAKRVLATGVFAISILAEDQVELSNRFAGYDPVFRHEADRFQGLQTEALLTGAPLLEGAVAHLDCKVWAVYEGSTHHIITGEVVATASLDGSRRPLVYYHQGYCQLAKLDGY